MVGAGFGMVLFWALLIAAVVIVAGLVLRRGNPSQNDSRSATEILKQRYASGEISKEQFEQMKRDLSGS